MNRFYRSSTNRVAFGICGALAEKTRIPAGLLRALCVLLFFLTSGSALVIYLLLGMSLPAQPKPAQQPPQPRAHRPEDCAGPRDGAPETHTRPFTGAAPRTSLTYDRARYSEEEYFKQSRRHQDTEYGK